MSSHFRRLRQAHHGQQRWRQVAQRARISQPGFASDIQERHLIQGMRGMRLMRGAIQHLFGIAVVGGDDDLATNG